MFAETSAYNRSDSEQALVKDGALSARLMEQVERLLQEFRQQAGKAEQVAGSCAERRGSDRRPRRSAGRQVSCAGQ